MGGLVHSLPMLTLVYSLNRLAGSAGWGGMVKQVPGWFFFPLNGAGDGHFVAEFCFWRRLCHFAGRCNR